MKVLIISESVQADTGLLKDTELQEKNMKPSMLLIFLLGLSAAAYFFGRRRAFTVAPEGKKIKNLHSRPAYYGMLTALWCAIPALIIFYKLKRSSSSNKLDIEKYRFRPDNILKTLKINNWLNKSSFFINYTVRKEDDIKGL